MTKQASKAEQLAQRVKDLEAELHAVKVANGYLMGACRIARYELTEAGTPRALHAAERVAGAIETAEGLSR